MKVITKFLCEIGIHNYITTEIGEDRFAEVGYEGWDIYKKCKRCETEAKNWTGNKAIMNKLKKQLENNQL